MRTYELKINDQDYKITVKSFSMDTAELEVDGETIKVDVKNVGDDMAGRIPARALPTSTSAKSGASAAGTSQKAAPAAQKSAPSGGGGAVTAPIPGAILEVFVKEGDEVKSGQPVVKMEAMKMENIINAHQDGTVQSVSVNAGDAVSQGDELLSIG